VSHERVPQGRAPHGRLPHGRVPHRRAPHRRALLKAQSLGHVTAHCTLPRIVLRTHTHHQWFTPFIHASHKRASHRRAPHGRIPHRRELYGPACAKPIKGIIR
jgi:hypothetical protein